MSLLRGSSVLVTGGTGSFGREFIRSALKSHEPRRVVVFSRDELKQHEMRNEFGDDPRLRWFLGDIRDKERLLRAFRGVNFVVHAAALKQVDRAEYDPFEFVKTNVLGTQNVIEAAIDSGVSKTVALSTDKASSPINLYGATKLTADKLVVAANNYASSTSSSFSVVRYGNVMGSRGSVIPLFRRQLRDGLPLTLTDPEMTRFWISLPEAVQFVVTSLERMSGGEIFVPKIPSMKMKDLAEAIAPGHPSVSIGVRPGEKMHEEMISAEDSPRTLDTGDRYVITPTIGGWGFVAPAGQSCPPGFAYRSDTNDKWLDVSAIRKLIGLDGK